jgi:hypothetical protein
VLSRKLTRSVGMVAILVGGYLRLMAVVLAYYFGARPG